LAAFPEPGGCVYYDGDFGSDRFKGLRRQAARLSFHVNRSANIGEPLFATRQAPTNAVSMPWTRHHRPLRLY
jgi:hypothetical protein